MTAARLTPLDFQEADLVELASYDYNGFVMAEPGAGKTLIAIEAGLRSGAQRILVIAVRSTIDEGYIQGIKAQQPTADVRQINTSPEGIEAMERLQWGYAGWYIVTPQQFTRMDGWELVEPHLTIVDEAHLLGNADSKGNKKLQHLKSRRRMVMSGTMVRNSFENFWGLLRWVCREQSAAHQVADISRNRWIRDWCDWEADHFAANGMKVIGEAEPGALAEAIPVAYIQHFKRESCCEFHPNGFLEELEAPDTIKIHVDMTAAQQRMIRQMEDDYVAYLADAAEQRHVHVVKLPVVAQTRLRQMALGEPSMIPGEGYQRDKKTGEVKLDKKTGEPMLNPDYIYFEEDCKSPKLDALVDMFEGNFRRGEVTLKGEQALVLTSSQRFIAPVVAQLQAAGVSAVEWSGKTSDFERALIKKRFITGEFQVVVAVTAAIGTGTDSLQFATNNLVWLDRSRDMTDNIQAESRLDRRGQTTRVLNIDIIANGSMDEGIISQQIKRRLSLNRSLRREWRKQAA